MFGAIKHMFGDKHLFSIKSYRNNRLLKSMEIVGFGAVL